MHSAFEPRYGGRQRWRDAARRGRIQRQPDTDSGTKYGLALAGSRNKYVAKAIELWTTQKSMKVEEFAETLMKAIKTDLLSQGAPDLNWNIKRGLGADGIFDSKKWLVEIDPDKFSEQKVITVADLTLPDVEGIVGTLYHESRHTDQDVLIIRALLDQKKTVEKIFQETEIPKPIIKAVAAKKFKTPLDDAQKEHAKRMFVVMYGEHKELLNFLMKNTQTVEGLKKLAGAGNAGDLKRAEPHVKKLAEWAKNVLEPKVKKLAAGKKLGPQETELRHDLGELSQVTPKLVAAFDIALKMKNPTKDALEDLQDRTNEWLEKLDAAYHHLEGEKDAYAVEGLVKQEFEKEATAKLKPKPVPTKKK